MIQNLIINDRKLTVVFGDGIVLLPFYSGYTGLLGEEQLLTVCCFLSCLFVHIGSLIFIYLSGNRIEYHGIRSGAGTVFYGIIHFTGTGELRCEVCGLGKLSFYGGYLYTKDAYILLDLFKDTCSNGYCVGSTGA